MSTRVNYPPIREISAVYKLIQKDAFLFQCSRSCLVSHRYCMFIYSCWDEVSFVWAGIKMTLDLWLIAFAGWVDRMRKWYLAKKALLLFPFYRWRVKASGNKGKWKYIEHLEANPILPAHGAWVARLASSQEALHLRNSTSSWEAAALPSPPRTKQMGYRDAQR